MSCCFFYNSDSTQNPKKKTLFIIPDYVHKRAVDVFIFCL